MADPLPEPRRQNRVVTRFVLGFVALSLVAAVAPLLTLERTRTLVPWIDRSSSLVVYGAFLLWFFGIGFPAGFRRDSGHTVRPWWVLATFVLAFAAVPLVVAAWISGVSSHGLLVIGSLIASAAGCSLLARALAGVHAFRVMLFLGITLGLLIPGLEILAASLGLHVPWSLAVVSPTAWLYRVACERELPALAPFIAAAVVPWFALPFAARRRRAAGAAVSAALLLVVLPVISGAARAIHDSPAGRALDDVRLTSDWSVTRSGARAPLHVLVPRGTGLVRVRLRSETHVVDDGDERTILVTPTAGEVDVEVQAGGPARRVRLPFAVLSDAEPIVAWSRAGGEAAPPPGSAALHLATVDLATLGAAEPALETFDALIVSKAEWDQTSPAIQRARTFAALGGHCVVLGAAGERSTFGQGWIHHVADRAAALALATTLHRRLLEPFDGTLRSLFANPDWQELDLSRLILFIVLYHVAFVLAFLVPLRLDSHKSESVYLVSVAFVLVLVVLGARSVLRSFFLRDNQVYTHASTVVSFGAGGSAPAVGRQFRCYASMSGETWGLDWPDERGLIAYRDAGFPPGDFRRREGAGRLDGVWLDRFRSKLLVREDIVEAPALALERDGSGGWRVRPVDGVPDRLGLRAARVDSALLVDADGAVTPCRVESGRVVADPGAAAPAMDPVARALVGRCCGPVAPAGNHTSRRLLLHASGGRRLDETAGLFQVRDLGTTLVFDLED